MKKVIKLIAIIAACCILLTFLSVLSFDNVKSKINDVLGNKTDSFDGEFEEEVFYATSGEKVLEYNNISDLADGTRGFFVKGDNVFYCIKSSGHDTKGVELNPDQLNYGGYEYCYYTTTDMVTFTNYSDTFHAIFSGDTLIVYLAVSGLDKDGAINLSDKLLANQPINITYADPIAPEGPGAV